MKKRHLFFISAFFLFAGSAWAEEGFVKTSDGVQIFYRRNQAEKKLGAVILVHGWEADSDEWTKLSPFLYLNGWTTIAIDMRGHGASIKREDGRLIKSDSMTQQERRDALLDVDAIMPLVNEGEKIWILGSSFGAAVAYKYALEHPGVKGVILISPAFHYSSKAYKDDMKKYGKRPIFFVASKKDKISYSTAKKLNSKARGESKLIKVKGSSHGINELLGDKPEIQIEILKWLNKNS